MPKAANILPTIPYDINLLEIFISQQKLLLEGQQRIEQRLDAMEAQQCLQTKHKKTVELETLFTEKQLMQIFQVTRQTLYNHRLSGKLTYSTCGNRIRYTQLDIDNYGKIIEKRELNFDSAPVN